MFQNYDDISDSSLTAPRIAELRAQLKKQKIDAFLVPHDDEYMNEYIPECAERLSWLTGFTGSAGQAIVLNNKAALFTDGRYTLQAPAQVDTDIIEVVKQEKDSTVNWLKDNLKQNSKVGFDPKLHRISAIKTLTEKLQDHNIELIALKTNPIDVIWKDRPAPPKASITAHPLKYAGKKASEKIKEQQELLQKSKHDAVVLTLTDSIAWLFNIRGQDIVHNPLPLCFAIVHANIKPELFVEPEKLTAAAKKALEKVATLLPPDKLTDHLVKLGEKKAKTCLDPSATSYWFFETLTNAGAEIIEQQDPCQNPKAIKNLIEIDGARSAHERDGIAFCQFLSWLDEHAMSGELDEISIAKQLEQFRRDSGALKEISFDTISGSGPNGAIVHYRVTEKTNRKLKRNSLYLIDSGAQYLDGTTDITRTIAIGQPTKEMKIRFTYVLKGHINLALAHFPAGTSGAQLDILARQALWANGLDYAHGTGHGVGSYLCVHEGPIGISRVNHHELKPGMLLSNEPGYYKEGKYGIRIENLVLITEPKTIKGGETEMMSFETLTLAPIDWRLVDPSLLSDEELKWLNEYHTRVRRTIGPHLKGKDKSWLREATRAFSSV